MPKNPPNKIPKTGGTLKKPKNEGGQSPGKTPEKKRTAFPPQSYTKINDGRSPEMESLQIFFFCGEFQGILKPALGMRCSIHSSSFQLSSIAQRASKAKKKKNLGRGKQKVRVKRACVGAPKRPPSLTKRPWTQRVRGSLAPLATKDAVKIPQKGAANMPPRKGAPPGPHSGEGLGRSPLPTSV